MKHDFMEVVFIADVPSIAKKGDVKTVKDGYALNFLLPRKLAVAATFEAKNAIARQNEKKKQEKKAKAEDFEKLEEKVSKHIVTLKVRANDEGHLFGSVTAKEIHAELHTLSPSLALNMIEMDAPIKAIGEHAVTVRLGEKHVPLKVFVEKA